MYLEHFGLNEPPFRITPVTEFFFSGANRGEILDALIYSICEVEGIVKVSGEVGSGKTMLCRMLLEKLPGHIETIYLANPSLSREEMLYAIADGLGLNIKGERVGIIMQNIQNRLEEKAREGKRIVVLVDEAHAMPPDTLEELRLLYNLQTGNAKLLQLVLFGQPELNAKLDQPNMRQLKDRIVHHFNMQPLSRNILESYLMFRMRAANYHGPNIFSPNAIKLIAKASNGLMRRVNILADKSLLAAFIENTHNIEARHVQAAIRDSDLKPARSLFGKKLLAGSVIAAFAVPGLAAWWMLAVPQAPSQTASTGAGDVQESQPGQQMSPPNPVPQPAAQQPVAAQPDISPAKAAAGTDQTTVSPAEPVKSAAKTDDPHSPPAPPQPDSDLRGRTTADPAIATAAKTRRRSPRPESVREPLPTTAGLNPPPVQNVPKAGEQASKSTPQAEVNTLPSGATAVAAPEPVSPPSEPSAIASTARQAGGNPAAKEPNLFGQQLESGSQTASPE